MVNDTYFPESAPHPVPPNPVLEIILAARHAPFHEDMAEALIDQCAYTTTALRAFAAAQGRIGDEQGSKLIEEFAAKFAAYEASVL